MSIVSLRGIARFVVVFLDFSCGGATIPETLCGPDFREYFFLFFFLSFGPVLSTCREGTPVTGLFGFSCLAKRLFLALFPCSLGPGVPGLGLVFLACVTHPIFGPGLALLGVVSPIPFLGQVRLFFGVVFWLFWPFSPCVYSVPGLPGLF